MEVFARLIPYVRPHLRKLVVSWVLAIIIALSWGSNFMAAWPLVKTLLEKKSIHDEVAARIELAQTDIDNRTARISSLDTELEEMKSGFAPGETSGAFMRKAAERGRHSEKLTDATTQIAWLRWVEYRILDWLPRDPFETFLLVLGLMLVSTLIKCAALYVQESLVGEVVERTLQGVRTDSLQHALKLDYATTSAEGTAGLMSRFTFDAERMSEGLTLLSGRVVREPLKALVCVGIALYVNWRLTLVSVLVVPILGFMLHKIGQSIKRGSRRMMESMARIYEQLEETLNGLKVVMSFNRQQQHEEKFAKEYDDYVEKAVKVVRYNSVTKPASEVFSTIAVVLAMTPCAYLVIKGQTHIWGMRLAPSPMDVASIAMLYGAMAGLLDPCTKLARVHSRLKQCTAAIERIFNFLDTKSATPVPTIPKSMPAMTKAIEFRDVSFQYPNRSENRDAINPLVLDHLTLTIQSGECVAIVGENGCGKSTLLSFMPRFHEPCDGGIFIDGIPLSDIDVNEFREQVALVGQDTTLFNGSILENIQYGRLDATLDEVMAAAELASVTQFVENLPNGFDTNVGIQGKSLSGGQRQRIALARAMIREPKLLLLDEATSAIDAQSRDAIHAALKTFVKGRTTMMVTHSMSPTLLEFVTRIVVVADGRIEADGPHEKVLLESPTYGRLFAGQAKRAA